ncbi:V8-like Glu-specific endopeptidase [Nakamurella flavida]|uniref:trypsin-like serine peptidase n=1 Tax=Nakamurella flavida TaxID=363630 RepID=UPI002782BB7B|nr:serine protease [Nakamurella flavida]MDP9778486.1 V8-like Glu-specific endopeptidase [Nakamurella flavida]
MAPIAAPVGPAPDLASSVTAGILGRWHGSAEQRAATARAVAARDLTMANAPADLARRRGRLADRGLRLEGLVDRDDSVFSPFLVAGLTAARSVGRVVHARRGQPVRPVGTAALVTPSLVLTNNHVCPDTDTAAELAVEFGFAYDGEGGEPAPDRRACRPDAFFLTDADLDWTLIAVADRGTRRAGARWGHLTLVEQTGKAVNGEHLNVVHHPGGDRQSFSIRDNRMVAEDDLWLRYESDTRAGSSGAPVFNDQWEMVALHHGGVPRTDTDGHPLARTGQRWTPELGEDALDYLGNEGARVSRILRSLRALAGDLPADHRRLVRALLDPS